MKVFVRATVRIFSFRERLIVSFNSAIASLNGAINLSPHENILYIALINTHYLYNIHTRQVEMLDHGGNRTYDLGMLAQCKEMDNLRNGLKVKLGRKNEIV